MKTHTRYEVRNANDDAVVYAAFQHALQALRYWRDRGQSGALVKATKTAVANATKSG